MTDLLQAVLYFAATTVVPYGWIYAFVIGGALVGGIQFVAWWSRR